MAPKGRKSGPAASQRNRKKPQAEHAKIGLVFPIGRVGRYLKKGRFSERVGKGAGIFMAAVLEYITCEIIELAGSVAAEHGRKTIAPRHLQLAVRNDEELAKMMSATLISEGGYMSNIHPFLM